MREETSKNIKENRKIVFEVDGEVIEKWSALQRTARASGITIYRNDENEGKSWIQRHEYLPAIGRMVRGLGRTGEDYYDAIGEAFVIFCEIKAKEASVTRLTGHVPEHPMSYYITRIQREMIRVYRRQKMLEKWAGYSGTVDYEENDAIMNDPLIDMVEEAELENYRHSLTPTQLKTFMETERALDDDPEVEFDSNFRRKVQRLPKVKRDYSSSNRTSTAQKVRGDQLRDNVDEYDFPVTTKRIRPKQFSSYFEDEWERGNKA